MKYVTLNGLTKALAGTKSYIDSKISLAERITYINLFLLKEQSKLSPGKLYRIIDYQTTTIQENTQVAGHQFDVVVLALTENTLSEEAWACKHDGDYYFENSNLSAWKIWYSLENDTNRFAWAKPNDLMWGVKKTMAFKWTEMYAPAGEEDMIFTRYPEGDTVFTSGNYSDMPAYAVQGVLGNKTVILYTDGYPLGDYDYARTLWDLDSSNVGQLIQSHYIEKSYAPAGQEDATFIRYTYGDTWVQEGQYSGSQLYAFFNPAMSGEDGSIIYTMDLNYNSGYDVCDIMGNNIGRITYGDSTGVIYRMIDEYNNDCPYDFKNIQFSRKLLDGIIDVDEGTETYVYTFSWVDLDGEFGDPNFIYDFSIKGNNGDLRTDEYIVDGCHDNTIECCIANYIDFIPAAGILYKLNDNVFISHEISNDQWGTYGNKLSTNCYSNSFGNNCWNNVLESRCERNTFYDSCNNNFIGSNSVDNLFLGRNNFNSFNSYTGRNFLHYDSCNNIFGHQCSDNVLNEECSYNIFGSRCRSNSLYNACGSNTFGDDCYNNTLGNSCYNNTFRNTCYSNTFGISCHDNTFGNTCYSNTFGDGCFNNILENDCHDNTIGGGCGGNYLGNWCYNNTFGNNCYDNTMGDRCSNNTLRNYCNSNSFGNECDSNYFEQYCNYNTIATRNSSCRFIKSYFQYITIDSGNKYIYLTTNSTTSSSNNLQNIVINKGVNNTKTYSTINVNTIGQSYQIDIAKDSLGNIKQYCAADLIN